MNNTKRYSLYVAAFILGALFVSLWAFPRSTIAQYAADVVALCAQAPSRSLCYDKEIPKLMDRGLSMEDTFAVTVLVQESDPSYVYCHVLGHILSEKETAKDPSKWVEVVRRAPSGLCSNGAIHGAFQERFRRESLPDAEIVELKPILQTICRPEENWKPTHLEQATCTHALGHLTMYITEADIMKSLHVCDDVAINEQGYDFRQLCYDGVFMQLYQPLEPEDFALIEGGEVSKNERDAFCSSFSGERFTSCITESWPLYIDEIRTPRGTLAFCNPFQTDSKTFNRCLRNVSYILTVQFAFDQVKISEFCNGWPYEYRSICFSSAATRFIETDWRNTERAVSLCTRADDSANSCFEELIVQSTYALRPKSKEALTLCDALPPPFRGQCLEKQGKR